eukprot:TRINITY_DN19008_c0_g2_i1.p2 TRINITY_DN19008_c0_g2~~TRINITY_DN19008_c0_g2_i1.p2  ORF type:complete len:110 (-),score=42.91 TRINITY_DN19008_c0_g2_i1:78-407(-)
MWCVFFFFFKQKTAYEMLRSLVGSEMCIRDRCGGSVLIDFGGRETIHTSCVFGFWETGEERSSSRQPLSGAPLLFPCLLYTSDAADEEDSVDLGGRRIIKKKKNIEKKR